jgi:hypothetical protein
VLLLDPVSWIHPRVKLEEEKCLKKKPKKEQQQKNKK